MSSGNVEKVFRNNSIVEGILLLAGTLSSEQKTEGDIETKKTAAKRYFKSIEEPNLSQLYCVCVLFLIIVKILLWKCL